MNNENIQIANSLKIKSNLVPFFFEEKDETFIRKEILKKDNFLISFLTPSQNFLAENFTLPQGEGDKPVCVASIYKKRYQVIFFF